MRSAGWWVIGLAVMVAASPAAAAEVRVLCSNGLRAVMQELGPEFERASGHKLSVRYGLAAAFKQQIDAGEAFDVVVLTPPLIDDAIKRGLVAADTRSVIARAGIGVAVRAGAARPGIATTEAFKNTLLAAKSVAFAKEGASGAYFAGLLGRLGIAEQMGPKLKPQQTGVEVGEAVAHGDVELAVLPISEILPVQGAEVLAPFPPEVQSYVVMTAGVGSAAAARDAGAELIRFLKSPAALPVIARKGMEPG
ncbi:MAG TPA: substrate-binding domain-containing protein [Xanthobacteraceae bacterium]